MTGRYKAYSDYKESGVDWIPNIPFSWKVTSLRHLISSVRNGSTETQLEKSEELVAISRIETISTGEINMDKTGFVNPKLIPESFKLNVGDLLLSHINSLPMVGNVAQVQKNHLIYHGMNLLRLIPKDSVSSRYLYWQLKSDYSRRAIESIAKPAINQASVSTESLKALQLLCPSIAEQQKIASFLDHETAKIDTLIAKQEKLIELLKEKRQAVISHAVTKGLNPDAPMRDSGVEWLGEVPEHWVTSSIKYLSSFVGTGGTPKNQSSFVDDKDAIKWFAPGDFSDQIDLIQSSKHISYEAVTSGDAKLYKENSVLVIGIGATLGKVALCKNKFSCNQQINMITPNEKATAEFITYSLLAQHEQMKQSSNASTIGIMNQEKTKSIKVAQPPISEQVEIVNDLNIALEKFELIEAKAVEQIDLLKERKTALISAAVTGKIDVRDFVSEQGQPQGIQG